MGPVQIMCMAPPGPGAAASREGGVDLREVAVLTSSRPKGRPGDAGLEAAEALVDVVDEAGFTELAVVGDVDADVGLAVDDLVDRRLSVVA